MECNQLYIPKLETKNMDKDGFVVAKIYPTIKIL
jgi:hypothetical protein